MAKLTVLNNAVTAGWAPDLLVGAVKGTGTATELRYSSIAGYQVVLTGTGFSYDSDGEALRGAVGTIQLFDSQGNLALKFESVHARLDTILRYAFGPVDDDGAHGAPDGAALMQHLLRYADLIEGSSGNDTLFAAGGGGFSNDTINGGQGDDLIRGDYGSDILSGGDGWDMLSYESSRADPFAMRGIVLDVVLGTVTDCWSGVDTISGFEAYKDSVYDDRLVGSSAASEVWHLTSGMDTLVAGGGTDWLDYAGGGPMGGRRGIEVDLTLGKVKDPWGEYDRITGVEGVGGTARADIFLGDGFDNTFDGRKGQDTFDGKSGFDRVGFWEVARLAGHGVSIDLALTTGQIMDDGFGNIEKLTGIEAFTLSSLADRFAGGAAADDVSGGDGNDTIYGRDGDDRLFGDGGDDMIFGGNNSGYLSGGSGKDQLTGGSRDDDFAFFEYGAANADTIFGFNATMDQIFLAVSWGGLAVGAVTTSMLRVGAGVDTANSSTQRILYNSNTGELFFDRDGAGGAAAELFAVLDNKPSLNTSDFWVMS